MYGRVRVCMDRWGCVSAGEGVYGRVRVCMDGWVCVSPGGGVYGRVRVCRDGWRVWSRSFLYLGQSYHCPKPIVTSLLFGSY